jgi:hypothetical protein
MGLISNVSETLPLYLTLMTEEEIVSETPDISFILT